VGEFILNGILDGNVLTLEKTYNIQKFGSTKNYGQKVSIILLKIPIKSSPFFGFFGRYSNYRSCAAGAWFIIPEFIPLNYNTSPREFLEYYFKKDIS
jgi:hypothetical protein